MTRSKAPCRSIVVFLKHHGTDCTLGALTGQDRRALEAFAHLVEFYAVSDDRGRDAARRAMSAVLDGVQLKVWPLFKKCIPHGLDWSDEDRLWQEITA
jgi:hypothetical protein